MLVAINTHPVQYHAPVFRYLQQELGIPLAAIYGADFSVAGYKDREFGAAFAWDVDLLEGYRSEFLSRVAQGGARSFEEVGSSGMAAALERLQPRAILSMGFRPRFHADSFRIARRRQIPVLFRAETTDHAVARGWLKRWMRDLVLRRHYAGCAALLPIGVRSREHYARLGVPAEKMFFSPYCVDTAPFRTSDEARAELRGEVRRAIGADEAAVVLGYFGKLSPRKAPGLLVDAVRLLPPDIRRRCLVLVVGDGELRSELQLVSAMEPKVALRLVGFQNQQALSRWYHACEMVVMPSLYGETWGLIVNESLHHGVPVVVSEAVGCAPDLVVPGRTGEVVAAGSPAALAEGISRLLPQTGTPEVRHFCRAQVAHYTVAAAATGIAEAYRRVCAADAAAKV